MWHGRMEKTSNLDCVVRNKLYIHLLYRALLFPLQLQLEDQQQLQHHDMLHLEDLEVLEVLVAPEAIEALEAIILRAEKVNEEIANSDTENRV